MKQVGEVVQQYLADQQVKQEEIHRQEVREGALAWLQGHWKPEATELPPGHQGNPMECVFAEALGGSFGVGEWTLPEDRLAAKLGFTDIELPEVVSEFIRRFDAGEYPDLIR